MTDHYLLMTATPHKGDPENFRLFLALLDRDVYGRRQEPRRGDAASTRRRSTCAGPRRRWSRSPTRRPGEVQQAVHQARGPHRRLRPRRRRARLLRRADPLRRGPVDQGRRRTTRRRGRAVGFTMAMLQRRLASSIYAVRRSLERMQATGARRSSTTRRRTARSRSSAVSPTTSTICPKTSSRRSSPSSKDVVASVDPAVLREEIARLTTLIDQAQASWSGARSSRSSSSCSERPDGAGRLHRPEDEAAGLHRAQGHARLPRRRRQGRPPARQAPRVGPDGHPDPRRHEDRRPRHARHAASTPSASSARTRRSWSPPRPPAKASTSSSAGS